MNVGVLCRGGELDGEVAVAHAGAVPVGASVTVMVRPEKIVVQREASAGAVNQVKGVIADIAYLGDVSIFHVVLPSGRRIEALRTNLRHTGDQELTWEDEVTLAWHPGNALVLTR